MVLARDVHPPPHDPGRPRGPAPEWALKLIPAPAAATLADVEASAPMLLNEARIHLLMSQEPAILPCLEVRTWCEHALPARCGGLTYPQEELELHTGITFLTYAQSKWGTDCRRGRLTHHTAASVPTLHRFNILPSHNAPGLPLPLRPSSQSTCTR